MERYRIVLKIAEMKSYIASDWPSIEERKRLYRAIEELETRLKETPQENKPEKE